MSNITGLVLLVLAGIMNATFSLPMKFTKRWAWENTWLVWSLFALVMLPPLIAYATVPDMGTVYRQAGTGIVLAVALFGAGWGVAQVLFGLALEIIGIALTFSIVLGLSAAMGSLIPLLRLHHDRIVTPAGLTALGGIVLVLAGVAVCAAAGRMREKAAAVDEQAAIAGPAAQIKLVNQPRKTAFATGLLIAVASGICASMMNFGIAFGGPILDAATHAGAKPYFTVNAVWLPLLLAGAVPNVMYCIYLMQRNQTASNYAQRGTAVYVLLALIMACFWFGSSLLYGASLAQLGELGAVLGWPLFMSLIVIVASVLGVVTGEWRAAGPRPLRLQMCGVGVLIVAVVVLSRASLS
jgi:L-rhamnose-H+ transport protein